MRLLFTLMVLSVSSNASYFRPMDPTHIRQSASVLYDPAGVSNSVGVTDIALITHSTEDGSVIPAGLHKYLPPEDWSPLAIGFGGSLRGDAVICAGASINVAPQISTLIMGWVGADSPPWARALKSAMAGSSNGKLRIGWAEMGTAVRAGVFQSAKQAFPGEGALDILRRAGRIQVGWAWEYGR